MAANKDMIEEFTFAAEGLAGTAASAALRRIRSLAETAPAGRLFASISTLTDMSREAGAQLESGGRALARGDSEAASVDCARALIGLDRLANTAAPGVRAGNAIPSYLRKSR